MQNFCTFFAAEVFDSPSNARDSSKVTCLRQFQVARRKHKHIHRCLPRHAQRAVICPVTRWRSAIFAQVVNDVLDTAKRRKNFAEGVAVVYLELAGEAPFVAPPNLPARSPA